jgi:hypothetical protein
MQSIKLCLALLCLCLFISCERDEAIVQDDGQEFCPVNFRYKSNLVSSSLFCTNIPLNTEDPIISSETTGFVFSQNLFEENAPYFSWTDSLEQYKAYHILDKGRSVRFDFEKRSMSPGTRVSLFAGPTILSPEGTSYWESGLAYDTDNHFMEVFIECIDANKYVLNTRVNGELQSSGTEIPDFERGFLQITIGFSGITIFRVGYLGGTVAQFFESSLDAAKTQVIIDQKPFAGVGFFTNDASCAIKNISIKPQVYEYIDEVNPSKIVTDNFTCNSIWILR